MQETFKEFTFEAAHQTPPHSGLHGHSFRVEVVLTGERDPVFGWTHNLYEVAPKVEAVRQQLDHRYLNEIEGLETPTLENITRWIWTKLDADIPGVARVVVRRGSEGQVEGCTYSGRP